MGVIRRDVGTLTIKPIMSARGHRSQKLARPTFTNVRVSDIAKDMPTDISTANNTNEYFLFTFNIITLQQRTNKNKH